MTSGIIAWLWPWQLHNVSLDTNHSLKICMHKCLLWCHLWGKSKILQSEYSSRVLFTKLYKRRHWKSTISPKRVIGSSSLWVKVCVDWMWAVTCVRTGNTVYSVRGKTLEWTEFASIGDPDRWVDVSSVHQEFRFWAVSSYCVCICMCVCCIPVAKCWRRPSPWNTRHARSRLRKIEFHNQILMHNFKESD